MSLTMFYASVKDGFYNLNEWSLGKKLFVGATILPLLMASIPLILFMLYRASKTAKELQKVTEVPTVRVEGEIIDIPSKQRINS